MKTLNLLSCGETAYIKKLNINGSVRRRFFDIGLINDTFVECVAVSPMGDPKAFLVRGAVIAIRNKDSACIVVG